MGGPGARVVPAFALLAVAALGPALGACAAGGPTAAATQSALGADDLRWVAAVEDLRTTMDEAFTGSPATLTPANLRRLADDLRRCTGELERMGTPSAPLAPAYALVRRACREYDAGAECLVRASRLVSGSGLQRNLDCAHAAARRGAGPLAEAVARAVAVRGGQAGQAGSAGSVDQ